MAMSRRPFLVGGAAFLATAACSSQSGNAKPQASATTVAGDFEARFARFEAADEINGDLSKVVWPEFVTRADAEVKQLYEFQVTHGDVMRYMPCFCGCGQTAGHRNNRDCYVQDVAADGSVGFDSMAPT
jgi:hypothetical protein